MVEDKQKVNEFMGYLDSYAINETKNPESVGWIQSAEFYINDKDVMGITFGDPIVINGNYYKVMKDGLDFKDIGKFIKSVDQSYDIMAGLE